MAHTYTEIAGRSPSGVASGIDDLCIVAVLEDSHVLREDIKRALERRRFLVMTPKSQADCLYLLSQNCCQFFVLDIGLDEGSRRVEGLRTLEAIKRDVPSVFCAIITQQDQTKYRKMAENLHADWFSGKSDEDLGLLIQRIEIEYLRRRFDLSVEPTLQDVGQHVLDMGVQTRRESLSGLDSARALAGDIRNLAATVLHTLSEGDLSLAEDQLVLLEPGIRRLLAFKSDFGDGYGIVIGALWNALVNQPGSGVAVDQIRCWLEVLESAVDRPPGIEEAVTLVDRLEESGFDPDPPGIGPLLDVALMNEDDQAGDVPE